MSRNALRARYSIIQIVAGACTLFLPESVWAEPGTSGTGDAVFMKYVGGFLVAIGILGLCGVNVFMGCSLDKRRDSTAEECKPPRLRPVRSRVDVRRTVLSLLEQDQFITYTTALGVAFVFFSVWELPRTTNSSGMPSRTSVSKLLAPDSVQKRYVVLTDYRVLPRVCEDRDDHHVLHYYWALVPAIPVGSSPIGQRISVVVRSNRIKSSADAAALATQSEMTGMLLGRVTNERVASFFQAAYPGVDPQRCWYFVEGRERYSYPELVACFVVGVAMTAVGLRGFLGQLKEISCCPSRQPQIRK